MALLLIKKSAGAMADPSVVISRNRMAGFLSNLLSHSEHTGKAAFLCSLA